MSKQFFGKNPFSSGDTETDISVNKAPNNKKSQKTFSVWESWYGVKDKAKDGETEHFSGRSNTLTNNTEISQQDLLARATSEVSPDYVTRVMQSVANSPLVPKMMKDAVSAFLNETEETVPPATANHLQQEILQTSSSTVLDLNSISTPISISQYKKKSFSPITPSSLSNDQSSLSVSRGGSVSLRGSGLRDGASRPSSSRGESYRFGGSMDSSRSTSSSQYELSYEKLDAEIVNRLNKFQFNVVKDLYRSQAKEILQDINDAEGKDRDLAAQIEQKRKEIRAKIPGMDNSQLEDHLEIKGLQEKRDQLTTELKVKANKLQEQMEKSYGAEMEIIQDSTTVTKREERRDGVMFTFNSGRNESNTNFQMDVQEWIKRKKESLKGAPNVDLTTRLSLKYQSKEGDIYGRAQECAKWHLTLINYLKDGQYKQYRDFSQGHPQTREHTGKEAEIDRKIVWSALGRNAAYLAYLVNNDQEGKDTIMD